MEVDGKPGVVARRNNRGRQRPQRQVKLTFSQGARLPDPFKLFHAGLGGNAWRAVDLFEGDKINRRALKNLTRAAVDYNQIKLKKKAPAGGYSSEST
jgi:hypothetical protein